MLTYCGVGSRETPSEILDVMTSIAVQLAPNWLLRSGGAQGADSAFEDGAGTSKEIWIPWFGFNGLKDAFLAKVTDESRLLAETYHPRWEALSDAAKLLMVRNAYVLMGKGMEHPADMVVCWTPQGQIVGGTGHLLRMAHAMEIPVFNLAIEEHWPALENFVGLKEARQLPRSAPEASSREKSA